MDVDRPRQAHGPVDDRAPHQLGPPGTPAGPEHELGGVLGPGELNQGGGDVAAGGLVVGAAQLLQKPSLVGDRTRILFDPGASGTVKVNRVAFPPGEVSDFVGMARRAPLFSITRSETPPPWSVSSAGSDFALSTPDWAESKSALTWSSSPEGGGSARIPSICPWMLGITLSVTNFSWVA